MWSITFAAISSCEPFLLKVGRCVKFSLSASPGFWVEALGMSIPEYVIARDNAFFLLLFAVNIPLFDLAFLLFIRDLFINEFTSWKIIWNLPFLPFAVCRSGFASMDLCRADSCFSSFLKVPIGGGSRYSVVVTVCEEIDFWAAGVGENSWFEAAFFSLEVGETVATLIVEGDEPSPSCFSGVIEACSSSLSLALFFFLSFLFGVSKSCAFLLLSFCWLFLVNGVKFTPFEVIESFKGDPPFFNLGNDPVGRGVVPVGNSNNDLINFVPGVSGYNSGWFCGSNLNGVNLLCAASNKLCCINLVGDSKDPVERWISPLSVTWLDKFGVSMNKSWKSMLFVFEPIGVVDNNKGKFDPEALSMKSASKASNFSKFTLLDSIFEGEDIWFCISSWYCVLMALDLE